MTELLGYKVRDKLNGLVGTAERYGELLSGTKQYALQPMGDGDKVPDGYNIDHNTLERVPDTERLIEPIPADDSVVVQLGDKVEDLITGATGIVTRKVTFINGCVYFDVTARADSAKDGNPLIHFLDHKRLKVLESLHFQKLAEAAKTPQPKRETGGPTTRAERI